MEFSGSAPRAGQDQDAATQARDKASEVTGQAQEKAQEVAGQAQEKAQEAAQQVRSRAQQEIDQRSTQAGEHVSSTASDLRGVGEELRNRGNDSGARVAEQAAQRVERVGSYLQETDGEKLLNDIEDFGRRQPWAVLAAGLAAGFVAARFLKASSQQRYQTRSGSQPSQPRVGSGTTSHSYGGSNPSGPGYDDGMGATPDPGVQRGAPDVAPQPSGVPTV
jgi:predicted glycosyl hydrolase (DUF1957 family)